MRPLSLVSARPAMLLIGKAPGKVTAVLRLVVLARGTAAADSQRAQLSTG